MQYIDIFKKLTSVDVNDRLQNKNGFSYLPWADCEQFAYNTIDPELIQVTQAETMVGLTITPMPGDGYMVKAVVTIAGVARGDWYPVIDYDNRVIKSPNAFDINTALQRAKVKAFAQHGLGLYVFLGKDGPQEYNPNVAGSIPDVPPKSPPKKAEPTPVVTPPKATPKPVAKETVQDTVHDEKPTWPDNDVAPWETPQRNWLEGPFDEEDYLLDFGSHIQDIETVEGLMAFVQGIVKDLTGADKTSFRTAVWKTVEARAKKINGN
jgi:hypothetical protein